MNAALVLALALGAPVEIGKDGKGDKATREAMEKLQGVWKATAVESLGRALPPATVNSDRYTLVVDGDAYVLLTHAGTVKLDPAKKTIDLIITEGRYKGTTAPGLYELSGDTLKIALAVPSTPARALARPTDLKASAEARHTLYTFEKDGKATREQAAARLKNLTETVARGANPPGFAMPGAPAGLAPMVRAGQANEEALKKVLEKLEAIEKRLDAIEKRLPPAEKK